MLSVIGYLTFKYKLNVSSDFKESSIMMKTEGSYPLELLSENKRAKRLVEIEEAIFSRLKRVFGNPMKHLMTDRNQRRDF
jgi:hypothetical protein